MRQYRTAVERFIAAVLHLMFYDFFYACVCMWGGGEEIVVV